MRARVRVRASEITDSGPRRRRASPATRAGSPGTNRRIHIALARRRSRCASRREHTSRSRRRARAADDDVEDRPPSVAIGYATELRTSSQRADVEAVNPRAGSPTTLASLDRRTSAARRGTRARTRARQRRRSRRRRATRACPLATSTSGASMNSASALLHTARPLRRSRARVHRPTAAKLRERERTQAPANATARRPLRSESHATDSACAG